MLAPVITAAILAGALTAVHLRAGPAPKDDGPVARLSEAPPSALHLQNPYAGQNDAVAAGRKLFGQHCSECHGSNAEGVGRAPSLHLDVIQSAPPGALFWAIRNGRLRKGMPSWAHLPDQQIWQIVTYLRSLEPASKSRP